VRSEKFPAYMEENRLFAAPVSALTLRRMKTDDPDNF
jgi:hypothetical protein